MDARRSILVLVVCSTLSIPVVQGFQSCPSPGGYDSSSPVRITQPVFGYISAALPLRGGTSVTVGSARALTGDYRPYDLLGWTPSHSVCDATSGSDAPCGAHRVYVPNSAVTPREPLVVFLPGSSMTPDAHDLVLKTAAYAGYRTIGLSYDTTNNVDKQCTFLGFHQLCGITDCYASKRDEVILGVDASPDVEVQPADSILERLFALLSVLYRDDITDGSNDYNWDVYFSPQLQVPLDITVENIAWDRIIIAGFSQGAGHAARISKAYRVHGTIMIDGPGDMCYDGWFGDLVPAQWLDDTDGSAGTPRYGALHSIWIDTFGFPEGEVPPSWQAMGIGDDGLVSIDPPPIEAPTASTRGTRLHDVLETDPILDFDPTWLYPPAPAITTAQTPAGTDGECLDISSLGLPAGTSQQHGSMADDRCMPSSFDGAELATRPSDAYLFSHYLKRFCYACDAATCP